VATPPGLAVLKVFSFFERRRSDDLKDLYFITRHYAEAGNEDRIFDELRSSLASSFF
jgi:predicted nucleotidyltransferase